ncbi:MAG: glycosyltransferase family 1 protein [Candidatus Omnitrophica bacterium]|nr:glycosyltransferase family 1 protein [Candidatus Omnitrophota bacterium]
MGERCQKILKSYRHQEISQFDLKEATQLTNEFDLYLRIDDGSYSESIPSQLHPYAWWISDTHLKKPFKSIVINSRNCDHLFCCQKQGAKKLSAIIKKQVHWLAGAADELPNDFEFKSDRDKKWDICFIGTKGKYSLRKVILENLKINYKSFHMGRAEIEELSDYYSHGRITVNYPINNDINLRFFEAMSAGALVITHRIIDNGFEEIFRDGKHLIVVDDIFQELKEKIDYYLKNIEEREKIAKTAFEYIHSRHTYRHRLIEMFKIMGYSLEQ